MVGLVLPLASWPSVAQLAVVEGFRSLDWYPALPRARFRRPDGGGGEGGGAGGSVRVAMLGPYTWTSRRDSGQEELTYCTDTYRPEMP